MSLFSRNSSTKKHYRFKANSSLKKKISKPKSLGKKDTVSSPLIGEERSKRKKVLVFDLHDVLSHADKRAMYKFIKKNYFYSLKAGVSNLKQWGAVLYNWMRKCKKSKDKKSFEGCLKQYIEQHKNDKNDAFFNKFVRLANLQSVDMRMRTLIENAKKEGVKIVLASNIGEKAFDDACKNHPDLKSLFELFDGFVYARPIEGEEGYIAKPAPRFFKFVIEMVKKVFQTEDLSEVDVLFIDDSQKNCASAQKVAEQEKVNLVPLHFKNFDISGPYIKAWLDGKDIRKTATF